MGPIRDARRQQTHHGNWKVKEVSSLPIPKRNRWTPKVKPGCITCKIRKVKCDDEQKPYCRRCVSTGRKCDEYAPPRPPLPKS
ncbi:hypothetical protein BDV29DRAFT_175216 [Aspergillus leporis]|uniref:Zn(2)-C6 fungal-type domain-containing protein n=1 Tax=Aspergillus leporis TaxID=41062 RepID=A0A5N5WYF1_9EURO|nr:hypothetical protein BDV29DRAFT_175216 [Aspergillus leporis]